MTKRPAPVTVRLSPKELAAVDFLVRKYQEDIDTLGLPETVSPSLVIRGAILAAAKSKGWDEAEPQQQGKSTETVAEPNPVPPPTAVPAPAPPEPTQSKPPPKPAAAAPPAPIPSPDSRTPPWPQKIAAVLAAVESLGYSPEELVHDAGLTIDRLLSGLSPAEMVRLSNAAEAVVREHVRARLLKAHDSLHFQWKVLAADMHVNVSNLSAFKSGTKLSAIGIDVVKAIDRWLVERGF